MIKNLQLFLIFFGILLHVILVANRSEAAEITGIMDCRVDGINIQSYDQGKLNSFSGNKDLKYGDKLQIKYGLELGVSPKISVHVDKNPIVSWDDLKFWYNQDIEGFCNVEPESFSYKGYYEAEFTKRVMFFKKYGGGLYLSRYYKSDYEGFFWYIPVGLSTGVSLASVAVSCQHVQDKVDEIVDRLYNIFGEQSYKDCYDMFDEKLGKTQVEIDDQIRAYRERYYNKLDAK